MIKKSVIALSILVFSIFLIGCLDYKAYDISDNSNNADLVDEIAAIENELGLNKGTDEVDTSLEDIETEVVLPELGNTEEAKDVTIISIKENELVKLNVQVTDPDQDTVTYSFSPPLNSMGQWQTNYGDAGEYLITISATDGRLTTEKQVKIVVERVNVPPFIEPVNDIFVSEGAVVNFGPVVSDPNGDAVSVSVSEPLKSGTFVTDHTSSGEYQISVTASDGELETEKTFRLVVDDVNVLPELSNLADLTVQEGDVVKIEPDVSDLDEDNVIVTISEPVGDDGVWETGYTDHGNYIITVTADDGKDTITKKVQLTVEDVNMPPEIVDISLEVN